jgi:hypothetical protein
LLKVIDGVEPRAMLRIALFYLRKLEQQRHTFYGQRND